MIALFVSTEDIKRYNPIDGSVDPDKFITFVEIAQDIHLQNYLGTKLYERLQEGIVNDDLNANEVILLDKCKLPLIFYAAADWLPFARFEVKNGGTFAHTSENATLVTESEVEKVVKRITSKAEYYVKRLVDYLCNNSTLYPEYTQNTEDDIYPDRRPDYSGGWYLKDVARKRFNWRVDD